MSYTIIGQTSSGENIIRTSSGDTVVGGGAVMTESTYALRGGTALREERRTGRRSSARQRRRLQEASGMTNAEIKKEERLIKAEEKKARQELKRKEELQAKKINRRGLQVEIARETFKPYFRSKRETELEDYYRDVEGVVDREQKFQRKLYDFKSSAGLIVKGGDTAEVRFVKGAGGLFTDFVFAGGHFATAIDKARVTGKGLFLPEARGDVWAEMKRAGVATPEVLKERR